MHANSRDITNSQLREEYSIVDKDQTVQYHSETECDAAGKETVVHYITLNQKHTFGCIMISSSGKREARLVPVEDTPNGYKYQVTEYYIKGKKTTLENFHEDFFQKNNTETITSRKDVKILAPNAKELANIVLEPYNKTKDPKGPSAK